MSGEALTSASTVLLAQDTGALATLLGGAGNQHCAGDQERLLEDARFDAARGQVGQEHLLKAEFVLFVCTSSPRAAHLAMLARHHSHNHDAPLPERPAQCGDALLAHPGRRRLLTVAVLQKARAVHFPKLAGNGVILASKGPPRTGPRRVGMEGGCTAGRARACRVGWSRSWHAQWEAGGEGWGGGRGGGVGFVGGFIRGQICQPNLDLRLGSAQARGPAEAAGSKLPSSIDAPVPHQPVFCKANMTMTFGSN